MPREVSRRYEDPLDAIWTTVARRVGLQIHRSNEVFAATDGSGILTLGDPSTLDADDCLAQMVFHELCHSLVQGPTSFHTPDWGLDNRGQGEAGDAHVTREHACLRTQAALAGQHGLRNLLAPTTDFRGYYDALPEDPLAGVGEACVLARAAMTRATDPPWFPHLRDALVATRAIAEATARFAEPHSLWSGE